MDATTGWTEVWAELRVRLASQKSCGQHPEYPCVRTLAQGIVNDVVEISEDRVVVRSHRTRKEDPIPARRLKKWWDALQAHGRVACTRGHPNNPHPWRSRIVAAIFATCLPDLVRVDGDDLVLL